MANTYRVLDMRASVSDATEITIESARSPEEAVRQALDTDVVRSGHRRDIVARVYWQPQGQPITMVRLYRRVTG